MKIEKFLTMIPDENLQKLMWGKSLDADREAARCGQRREQGQHELVLHLVTSNDTYRQMLLAVRSLLAAKQAQGSARKLLDKIGVCLVQRGGQYGLSTEQIDELVALCASSRARPVLCPESMVSPQVSDVSVVSRPPLDRYDEFPEEWCSFESLREKSNQLKADLSRGQRVIDEINRRVKEDPQIALLTTHVAKAHPLAGKHYLPYDQYRAGREIPGAYVNGSDVRTSFQHFLLMGCPKEVCDASAMFDTVIRQRTRLMVSLNESGEAGGRINTFWKNESLKTFCLRDGWRIENIGERLLDQRASLPEGTRIPRLVESTLVARKGDTAVEIRHLHYDGWRDRQAMPSEELLYGLYTRIEELATGPQPPIAINCKGGVGRTGTVAVGLYIRRYIDTCLAEGREPRINIPEIIYREFRKQRAGIVGRPAQFAQIYSLAATYYERVSHFCNCHESASSTDLVAPSAQDR